MSAPAAGRAPPSPAIFIGPCSNGNVPARMERQQWRMQISMFTTLFSESRSRIDRVQIAALWALMVIGVLFVYSATMVTESALSAPLYRQKWLLQIVWYLVGLAAAGVICLVRYQTLARWSMIAYWCGIALLLLVLVFGTVRSGARRWF